MLSDRYVNLSQLVSQLQEADEVRLYVSGPDRTEACTMPLDFLERTLRVYLGPDLEHHEGFSRAHMRTENGRRVAYLGPLLGGIALSASQVVVPRFTRRPNRSAERAATADGRGRP